MTVAAAATVRWDVIKSSKLEIMIPVDEEEEEEKLMKLEVDSELRAKRGWVVSPRTNYAVSEWSDMLREPFLRDPASKQARLFRQRFRVPFAAFKADCECFHLGWSGSARPRTLRDKEGQASVIGCSMSDISRRTWYGAVPS